MFLDPSPPPACPSCGGDLPPWNVLTVRDLGQGLYDVGVQCPFCPFWEHAYYDTLKIRSAKVLFRTMSRREQAVAQKALTALINSEQRRVRLFLQKVRV